ncbi:MAG: site-specific integrase [Bacteroidota bacterium]
MNSFDKIRYALVFNRTGKLNRYGEGLIQVRAYQNRRNRYFSTGIYVKPEFWSDRYQKVATKHPNQFVYNQKIIEQMQAMEAFEIKMTNRHGGWPLDRLHEFENSQQGDPPKSFTAFFTQELDTIQLKPGSSKMYRLTLRKLCQFRPTVHFEELTYKLILDFDRFLKKQKLGGSSIHKHHVRLSRFVQAAIRQDFLEVQQDPYRKFKKSRGDEPERPFLNVGELARVEALTFAPEDEHIERIRDLFLLCCYTGLRYGDASNLTAACIEEIDKGIVLDMTAEKTGKRLQLPLYHLFRAPGQDRSRPELILLKYLDEIRPLLGHNGVERIKIFDYTNQRVNQSLKLIAERARISKRVTCHVARRTFATQMATRVKLPILQRLLQHSRPDMTAIYVQLSNTAIEKELEGIAWE